MYNLKNIERWSFGIKNDYLISLVLIGKKKATSSLYNEKENNNEKFSILVYSDGRDACLVETKEIKVLKFKEMSEELAFLEGEGSFDKWKKDHYSFFKSEDKLFNENTLIKFEIFEVKEIF